MKRVILSSWEETYNKASAMMFPLLGSLMVSFLSLTPFGVRFKTSPVLIIQEEELNSIQKDYKLIGNWVGHQECHVESDCLLIYKIRDD